MRSVGHELLPGGIELSFGLQPSFEVGLTSLSSHEFSVCDDDGEGDQKSHQEASEVPDSTKQGVGSADTIRQRIS